MRHLVRLVVLAGLILGTYLLVSAGAQYDSLHISCNGTARYGASTKGSTRLVVGTARPAYICGYTLWAGGTASVKFISGTGTDCATASADITPAFDLTTQTGISDTSPFYRGLAAGPNRDICINTSAGVAVQALVFYRQ